MKVSFIAASEPTFIKLRGDVGDPS